ncbi:hypothetical protein ACQ4LE_007476 [Meloidogyne hapla]
MFFSKIYLCLFCITNTYILGAGLLGNGLLGSTTDIWAEADIRAINRTFGNKGTIVHSRRAGNSCSFEGAIRDESNDSKSA